MGLDIINHSSRSLYQTVYDTVEAWCTPEASRRLITLLDEGKIEELKQAINNTRNLQTPRLDEGETMEEALADQLNAFLSAIEYELGLYSHTLNAYKPDAKELIAYTWVNSVPRIQDSRMGGYGTIHYGRAWASAVSDFYDERGEDVWTSSYVLTTEDIESIIGVVIQTGTIAYETETFPNLCNHSDCDGFYIPTQERVDFDLGSSYLLMKEIDRLEQVGAFRAVQKYAAGILEPYELNIERATIGAREIFETADTIYWVLSKLMYHAVDSLTNQSVIVFC